MLRVEWRVRLETINCSPLPIILHLSFVLGTFSVGAATSSPVLQPISRPSQMFINSNANLKRKDVCHCCWLEFREAHHHYSKPGYPKPRNLDADRALGEKTFKLNHVTTHIPLIDFTIDETSVS